MLPHLRLDLIKRLGKRGGVLLILPQASNDLHNRIDLRRFGPGFPSRREHGVTPRT